MASSFATSWSSLFRSCIGRALCGRRDDADDLCQEALAKAWQSRATFEPGTNLKAWLFVILRNQFYSNRRRAWRQTPWDQDLAERTLVTHASQESSIAFSDLVRAMGALTNEQREALVLVGAGGFAYDEAARICGCAVGTIKSRVARARQTLEGIREGSEPRPEGKLPPSGDAANAISAQLEGLVRKTSRLSVGTT